MCLSIWRERNKEAGRRDLIIVFLSKTCFHFFNIKMKFQCKWKSMSQNNWGHVSDFFLELFFNSSFIVSVRHPTRNLCHLACSGLNTFYEIVVQSCITKWLETCQHHFSRLAWSGDAIKILIAALIIFHVLQFVLFVQIAPSDGIQSQI